MRDHEDYVRILTWKRKETEDSEESEATEEKSNLVAPCKFTPLNHLFLLFPPIKVLSSAYPPGPYETGRVSNAPTQASVAEFHHIPFAAAPSGRP